MAKAPLAGAGIQVSPDRLLPLWFTGTLFAVGLLVFAAIPAVLWVYRDALAGSYLRHPGLLLATHLYAVGWGLAVALGAWQQLSVVAFSATPPPRPLLAAGLGMFLAGFALFVTGFAGNTPWLIAAGGALLFGAFLAAALGSLAAVRSGSRPSLMLYFALPAQLSLAGVAVVGVLLAVNLATGLLAFQWAEVFHSHVYLGPVGWYGMLVPGVSYELGPFFGITRAGKEKGRGRWHLAVAALLGTGFLLGLAASILGRFRPILLAPLALGYLLFVYDLRGIYGRRQESRRIVTLTGVRWGHAYLGVLAAVLLLAAAGLPVFSDPKRVLAVGWLAAAGFLSNTIAAYLHRILPFLLWHHRNWGKPKGEIKTPFIQMVEKLPGRLGFAAYNAGVIGVAAGIFAQALLGPALIALALGTWTLTFNLGRAYFR